MITSPLGMVLAFILTVAILVTFHEYGHFWVARRLGVKVLRFSVGFGRPLCKWYGKDGTEYVIAAIPLGGYVKMLDERVTSVRPEHSHLAFNTQTLGVRAAIVSAGPLANFLLAIVLYALMFTMGVPGIKPIVGEVVPDSIAQQQGITKGQEILSINETETPSWSTVQLSLIAAYGSGKPMLWELQSVETGNITTAMIPSDYMEGLGSQFNFLGALGIRRAYPPIPAVIGSLEPQGAGESAGLQPGDKIVQVNQTPIRDWSAWVQWIRDYPNNRIELKILRGNQFYTLDLIPELKKLPDGRQIGFVGVRPEPVAWPEEMKSIEQYSPLQAISKAIDKTWTVSVVSLKLLYRMIVGYVSSANLGGPISIAKGASQTLDAGIVHFLGFLALVSVSLALLNLMPIPVLDGGHLLFYAIEALIRRPVSERVQIAGTRIGVAILIAITILAFYNDLSRL